MEMTKEELKKYLFGHYPQRMIDRFKAWLGENPGVFAEFCQMADAIRNTGRKKYAAVIILNKIRWERDLKTTGDVFKINNDYSTMMARLLIWRRPEFFGFFEIRNPGKDSKPRSYHGSQEEHRRLDAENQGVII